MRALDGTGAGMRRKLVVGNWKMYGNLAWNKTLLEAIVAGVHDHRNADYAICVPHPYLCQVQSILQGTNVAWGGQNMNQFEGGAFTGSVAPHMLVDFGCSYVIIGHSERRQYFGETDEHVAKKVQAARRDALVPIICVGETLEERERGETLAAIARQVRGALQGQDAKAIASLVVAYEPVWAIGTGRTATPAQAQEVHAFIRSTLAGLADPPAAEIVRILYGGSVKPDNVDSLMAQSDIDGALVGGASLDAEAFARIVQFR